YQTDQQEQLEYARTEAATVSRTDAAYHRWFRRLGGLYAPVEAIEASDSARVISSDDEVRTASGARFRRLNPEAIVERVHRDSPKAANASAYTHTHLLRADETGGSEPNDAWSSNALRQLAAGRSEVTELVEEENGHVLRMVSPLPGDPTGIALRVDVPMTGAGYRSSQRESDRTTLSLSFFWLLGLAGIQGASALAVGLRKEQRAAFDQLQDRERRYRNVIESSPDGFWIVDEQAAILEVNDVYIRKSGYTREEIIGKHVWDFEARETAADTAAHMARMKTEGGAIFDTAHRAKDGSVWPVEAKVTYSPDKGGRYAAFFRDLTRHKRAESLEHVRANLADRVPTDSVSQLLEAAIRQAQIWTSSSGGYFHFLDATQGHITHRTLLYAVPPDAARSARLSVRDVAAWAECVRTGEPVFVSGDASTAKPSTHELVVPVRVGGQTVALFGVSGKPKEYLRGDADWLLDIGDIAFDLTRRKRAQVELTQFFNLVPDLVCILTAAGRMHRLNPEWERVLGVPLAEIQSASFLERVHPEDRRRTLHRFLCVARGGSVQRFVNRCRAVDGSYRWIEWNAASLPQEQLVYAAASDVTDRLRAERLSRLQRDLGMGLASATREEDPDAILDFCLA
ncbi:MAG: PAS domain S-box protein, partial [Verrucomicrobiales bacterium]|nr:PAS domain S-box protein [Verrucomicrobiales bacterium]